MKWKNFEERTDRMNDKEIEELLATLNEKEGDELIFDFIKSGEKLHKESDKTMEEINKLFPPKKE